MSAARLRLSELRSRPRVSWAARQALAGYHGVVYEVRRRARLGRPVSCRCCGATIHCFKPYGPEANVECPHCGSHPRHRLLCHLLFEDQPQLLEHASSLLHFAPENCLGSGLRAVPGLRYTSADLNPKRAMVACSIADLPFETASFDMILCSHVLEHVDDDRTALLELARMLRPGGTALILVPIDQTRVHTHEDHTIRGRAARAAAYGEPDHLRLYGRDFPRRLEAAGFVVTVDRYVRQLDAEVVARHNMHSAGVYVCTKP
jgi:Methyltransferase domain